MPDGLPLRTLLTGQVAVASVAPDGNVESVTGLQLPGVLDDLYSAARGRTLGPTWRRGRPRLALWAPTAKSVDLLLTPQGSSSEQTVPMTRAADGAWTVRGQRSWRDARYRFAVRVYVPTEQKVVTNLVTDPYSVGLTTNSLRSLLVDLDDPALKPQGWDRLHKPSVGSPEESSIYELHVRDFSIGDRTVPARHRGTYLAFTDRDSDGMRHLRRLARAGLNTVHLLPVNDIASIEEDRSVQQSPQCDLASYPPDSEQQQACVTEVAANDGFNWGYDPLHYTAPEGSYATDPSGTARNEEFREMVKGINGAGQRVVMDVVYNHTPASGQDPKSVLDRVVPGYYQRLNATGQVETSTCCANTATEHPMMEKLMIDSVLTWAKDYKVDGFRFDLMGHQPKAAMVRLRAALDRLTLGRDGVNGSKILLYGEGWNFGEVADNARFVQATQREMAGTGTATFNDRLRDAVRGGGPFDEDPTRAGLRQRPVHRPQRRGGQRFPGRPAAGPASQPGPDPGRADRQPEGLPVHRSHGRGGHRCGRRLQRAAHRVHQRPAGGGQLRRGARQRDAVRRPRLQAAAGHLDVRPDPHADARPVDDGAEPGHLVLARRRRPAAQQVTRPQQLRLRRLVQRAGPLGAHQRIRPRTTAAPGQRGQVGLHAPAAG